MAMLTWEDRFSVGVPEIDAQHQSLLDLINRTSSEPLAGGGRRQFIRTIEALLAYAELHFATEERLMQEAGYTRLGEHQEEHLAFSAEVRRLARLLETGSQDLHQRIAAFLRGWFLSHVIGTDQDYVPVLRRFRGSQPPLRPRG